MKRVFTLEKKFKKQANGMGARSATCHPGQPNAGGGLCAACYARFRFKTDAVFRATVIARNKASYQLHRDKRLARQAKLRKENPIREREKKLVQRYGLTIQHFETLLASQSGCCAVCVKPFLEGEVYVDHCHKSGAVRGLVHPRCNLVLGFIEKHPEIIFYGAMYLAGKGRL